MTGERMHRVSKANRCPICGKPDWCLVAADGSAAICARIADGAQRRCGDAGWLHMLRDDGRRPHRHYGVRISSSDAGDVSGHCERLAEQYQAMITSQQLLDISTILGVSRASLERLRIGWDGRAFTFPMSNIRGRIIGIRRRLPNGRKLSVERSSAGLFIPTGLSGQGPLLITEGESDCAAGLDLGFDTIGRPGCRSCVAMTIEYVRGCDQLVVVADNDEPGRDGAAKLATALALHCRCVKLVFPPDGMKDLRQWLRAGATHETARKTIEDAAARRVVVAQIVRS